MRELLHTVVLLGVLQGAVLSVVLARKSSNALANRILAALVACVALMLLLGYIEARWGFAGHPHWIAVGSPLPFLFGPLLYLYVVALTRPAFRLSAADVVHLAPFAAYVIYMAQVFFLHGAERKLQLIAEYLRGEAPFGVTVFDWIEVLQALGYVACCFAVLRDHRRKMQGYYSELSELDLQWLRRTIIAHAAVWSVVLARVAAEAVVGQVIRIGGPAIQLGSALVIFLTGYISLSQRELGPEASAAQRATPEGATPEPADANTHANADALRNESTPATAAEVSHRNEATTPSPALAKYQRNRLPADEAADLEQRLRACMTERRLYRDTNLTLQALADELASTPHALSQVLNVRVGRNFYNFVNGYRVEALEQLLGTTEHDARGVLELALQVGFNSKSTLNSFFKKATGLTPTEFRRQRTSMQKSRVISTG